MSRVAEIDALAKTIQEQGPKPPLLRALTVTELLTLDVKPREMILAPILPTQGLAMLYSKRGVGKTYLALGMAVAAASGGTFLRWKADKPRRALYIDGEMPCVSLQQRLSAIVAGSATEPDETMLRIITPDVQHMQLPDLATIAGQEAVEQHLDGVELLIMDNLSALCRAGKENEGEGWLPVQAWALDLRKRGISVLFVHHAGKAGAQRGTSRREDLLDTVVTLKHPSDYSPVDGLRCEVSYEKARGFYGDAAKPFEVRLQVGERGEAIWSHQDTDVCDQDRVLRLHGQGMSIREIEEETGIKRSKVHRLLKNPEVGI
jgi:putative DNA primase/helicase